LVAVVVAIMDGDTLLDPARAEVLLGIRDDFAMNPVVLDDVDASTLVLTAVTDDDVPQLNACVDGVGVVVLVILEVVDDVKTSVVAALVAEDDVLLLEAAADADVEVLVSPAVFVNAVSATVEGQGVLVSTALAVLDVDGDELLDLARAKVPVSTGVDFAMNPVVLDVVDANTLVLTAGTDDNVLLLEAVDAEVEVLASPALLEEVVFALGKNSNEPSSPVKLGAGLASMAPIRVSKDCGRVVGPVELATIELQMSTEVKSDSAWSDIGHGTGEVYKASPLRVIIYLPPHQKRTHHTYYSGHEHNSAGYHKQGGNPVLHATYMCQRTLLVLWHKKQTHPSEHSPGDRSARLWGDTTPDALAWRGGDYPQAHKPTVYQSYV